MSRLSLDNALNVLGISEVPLHQPALAAAYQQALALYPTMPHSAAASLAELLQAAHDVLEAALCEGKKAVASDPGYAHRLSQALAWMLSTPLSFEILGAWLWVNGQAGASAAFTTELQAHGFAWASQKACWYLRPQTPPLHPEQKRVSWDLSRIRSTYAHGLGQA